MTDRVWILGVPFDPVDLPGAVEAVERLLQDGRPHLVVTANPEAVMASRRDPELAAAIRVADLVVADGIGIVWASGHLQRPLPARVPGIELMEALCGRAAATGRGVYLLGGAPGVAERAAHTLQGRYPGLRIAGTHHGYFSDDAAVVARIAASGAEFLFAGLGMPRQEKWLARHLEGLGVRLAMGVGGSLDVLAGRIPRAPAWVRRMHLEWLYRLVRQPSRWRRQLALARFVWSVLQAGRGERRGSTEYTGHGRGGARWPKC